MSYLPIVSFYGVQKTWLINPFATTCQFIDIIYTAFVNTDKDVTKTFLECIAESKYKKKRVKFLVRIVRLG